MSEKINESWGQEYLDSITKEGLEISINIKILNSEKAKKLLGTMYGKHTEELGVEVHHWGFCNNLKAEQLRKDAMVQEAIRHSERLQKLLEKSDFDFLKELNKGNDYE